MGKLRTDFPFTATIQAAHTSVSYQIPFNNGEQVWVIEQIAVQYSNNADSPQVTILKNNNVYSGAAQFLRGNGALAQTFSGVPYLYMENDDNVTIRVDNGTAGAVVTGQIQYRIIRYDDSELEGRF